MKHKVILDLIKSNLEEMMILTSSFEKNDSPDPLFIDILLTKSHALQQELELLKTTVEVNTNIIKPTSDKEEIQVSPEPVQMQPEITEEKEDKIEEIVETEQAGKGNTEQITNKEDKREPDKVNDLLVKKTEEITANPQINQVEEKGTITDIIVNDEPQNEGKSKKVLGEQFSKEPSLNERFAETTLKGSKIKGKPVTSIKTAIGINDRFLYIRELFQNNSDNFEKTIATLDQFGSFIEAIEHLEKNFKWQKNDTSLKFMDLVKRRFED